MRTLFLSLFMVLLLQCQAFAHFGVLIPSKDAVLDSKNKTLSFTIAFSHPREQHGMTMDKPQSFVVKYKDGVTDLSDKRSPTKLFKHDAWKANFTVDKPGVYAFAVTPKPYFEKEEDCYIVHYTKVFVPAFGEEDGWDTPFGLPIEIVPLTRPFGNPEGSVFQGKVLVDGAPAANCLVEVEFNDERKAQPAPNPYFVTQVVKTDPDGVFTFVAPWKGWWAFAALSKAKNQLPFNGEQKDVEIGGVLWVPFGTVSK